MGITGNHNPLRRVSPLPLRSQTRSQTHLDKNPTSIGLWGKNTLLRSLAARRLRLHHPRDAKKYTPKLRQLTRQGNTPQRLRDLENLLLYPPSQQAIIEYEKNYLLIMKERRLANYKVRRLHMSGVQSPRAVIPAQLFLRLSNILINRKEEYYKIKLKKVCKLANTTRRHWWISLDITALTHQITKMKREYYKMKMVSGLIR